MWLLCGGGAWGNYIGLMEEKDTYGAWDVL